MFSQAINEQSRLRQQAVDSASAGLVSLRSPQMKIDFNRQINKKNTDCSKWDGQGGDYIPLWVADMDFPVAEPVLEALKKRLEHPFFGYTFPGESVYQAVISYYKRRYDFDVKRMDPV